MAESPADISVIICTRNRAESLRVTLDCLARADRNGLRCEVVVVDNGSTDATPDVTRGAPRDLSIRYLCEPVVGKSHGLNRALRDAPLGEIIAVLDDDMSPQPGWFQGVKAICSRWPDKGFFTGHSYVIWPDSEIPDWCKHPDLQGWAYSVMGVAREGPVKDGRWFSGNHFWFFSRVLADGRRFEGAEEPLETHIEMCEPQFMLRLVEEGLGGIKGPDAVCGHRVQRELLDFDRLTRRAQRVGRGNALARLKPYKGHVKQARLFRFRPILGRIYCVASLVGWGAAYLASWLWPLRSMRLVQRLQSIERLSTYAEYLRVTAQTPAYGLFSPRQRDAELRRPRG